MNINFHHQKIKKPHLNSESLSELKYSETEVSYNQFPKKNDVWWK